MIFYGARQVSLPPPRLRLWKHRRHNLHLLWVVEGDDGKGEGEGDAGGTETENSSAVVEAVVAERLQECLPPIEQRAEEDCATREYGRHDQDVRDALPEGVLEGQAPTGHLCEWKGLSGVWRLWSLKTVLDFRNVPCRRSCTHLNLW